MSYLDEIRNSSDTNTNSKNFVENHWSVFSKDYEKKKFKKRIFEFLIFSVYFVQTEIYFIIVERMSDISKYIVVFLEVILIFFWSIFITSSLKKINDFFLEHARLLDYLYVISISWNGIKHYINLILLWVRKHG